MLGTRPRVYGWRFSVRVRGGGDVILDAIFIRARCRAVSERLGYVAPWLFTTDGASLVRACVMGHEDAVMETHRFMRFVIVCSNTNRGIESSCTLKV